MLLAPLLKIYGAFMIGPISFVAGLICVYLFWKKKRNLIQIGPEQLPELNDKEFSMLRDDLLTAYSRLLYLGIAFLLLGVFYLLGRPPEIRLFYLLLIGGLAVSNIPPRYRIMRRLATANLSTQLLRQRGISL